jgi:hypothetical protein
MGYCYKLTTPAHEGTESIRSLLSHCHFKSDISITGACAEAGVQSDNHGGV